jgi:hypothetical protein
MRVLKHDIVRQPACIPTIYYVRTAQSRPGKSHTPPVALRALCILKLYKGDSYMLCQARPPYLTRPRLRNLDCQTLSGKKRNRNYGAPEPAKTRRSVGAQ